MRRGLFGFERAWVKAALDAIYPIAPSAGGRDVDGFFDDLVVHVPLLVWLGLRVAIWIVALAPLVLLRRLATISMLPPGDRVVVIRRLASSKRYAVRQLVLALKATGGLLYVSAPTPPAAPPSRRRHLPVMKQEPRRV